MKPATTLKELVKPPFKRNGRSVYDGAGRLLAVLETFGIGFAVERDKTNVAGDFAVTALNEKWERDFSKPLRWIKVWVDPEREAKGAYYKCPKCDGITYEQKEYKYCPHCGLGIEAALIVGDVIRFSDCPDDLYKIVCQEPTGELFARFCWDDVRYSVEPGRLSRIVTTDDDITLVARGSYE